MRLDQVTVGCLDLDASCTFHTTFGLRHIVDSPPHYARFETPSGETLSIHVAEQVASVMLTHFKYDDLDERIDALKMPG